ncbi:MAG TPA: enoyl-CoA hydratase/isomerase family protein [Dehalococcoidia bacterium]|nr:enoyl-CoA hydratase/isomerase family protein [Anaerolineae bacterium]HHE42096.1 enoyl-CoA hydratase/isomerase family protein [Dehalococcoidia bacterium]
MSRSFTYFTFEKMGELATITLDRPDTLNAFNLEMLYEFNDIVDELRLDIGTRFVVITGRGRAFCSGIDVTEKGRVEWYADPRQPNERVFQESGQILIRKWTDLHQITIAAVNGPCVGLGLGLVSCCDFRITAENAYYSIPETALGIGYSVSCLYPLLALIGPAQARRMIMTCDPVPAHEAKDIGLTHEVVAPDRLMSASLALVQKLSTKGPTALRLVKRMINAATVTQNADLAALEPELVQAFYLATHDIDEGLAAYRAKRVPRFHLETDDVW